MSSGKDGDILFFDTRVTWKHLLVSLLLCKRAVKQSERNSSNNIAVINASNRRAAKQNHVTVDTAMRAIPNLRRLPGKRGGERWHWFRHYPMSCLLKFSHGLFVGFTMIQHHQVQAGEVPDPLIREIILSSSTGGGTCIPLRTCPAQLGRRGLLATHSPTSS